MPRSVIDHVKITRSWRRWVSSFRVLAEYNRVSPVDESWPDDLLSNPFDRWHGGSEKKAPIRYPFAHEKLVHLGKTPTSDMANPISILHWMATNNRPLASSLIHSIYFVFVVLAFQIDLYDKRLSMTDVDTHDGDILVAPRNGLCPARWNAFRFFRWLTSEIPYMVS